MINVRDLRDNSQNYEIFYLTGKTQTVEKIVLLIK
jgi:hypothetical protein